MRPNLFKELLRKYREGKTTPQETKFIDDWYESFGEALPSLEKEQKKALRKQLYVRILDVIAPTEQAEKPPGKLGFWILAIAASTLVMAIVGFLVWQADDASLQDRSDTGRHYVEYAAEQGKLKKLQLPDGTEIWLNAGAKIGFYVPFGAEDERVVKLVEGEVFFDVVSVPTKPFVVHTDSLDTRVLGTSFTVKSYRTLADVSVSVTTGSVQLVNRNRKILGLLLPGQEAVYHKKADSSLIRPVDLTLRDAWMNGMVYLSEVSFAELALVFQNVYGQPLRAGSPQITHKRYSIQLDRRTRHTDVVRAICAIHRNHYRKEGNAFVIY